MKLPGPSIGTPGGRFGSPELLAGASAVPDGLLAAEVVVIGGLEEAGALALGKSTLSDDTELDESATLLVAFSLLLYDW